MEQKRAMESAQRATSLPTSAQLLAAAVSGLTQPIEEHGSAEHEQQNLDSQLLEMESSVASLDDPGFERLKKENEDLKKLQIELQKSGNESGQELNDLHVLQEGVKAGLGWRSEAMDAVAADQGEPELTAPTVPDAPPTRDQVRSALRDAASRFPSTAKKKSLFGGLKGKVQAMNQTQSDEPVIEEVPIQEAPKKTTLFAGFKNKALKAAQVTDGDPGAKESTDEGAGQEGDV